MTSLNPTMKSSSSSTSRFSNSNSSSSLSLKKGNPNTLVNAVGLASRLRRRQPQNPVKDADAKEVEAATGGYVKNYFSSTNSTNNSPNKTQGSASGSASSSNSGSPTKVSVISITDLTTGKGDLSIAPQAEESSTIKTLKDEHLGPAGGPPQKES